MIRKARINGRCEIVEMVTDVIQKIAALEDKIEAALNEDCEKRTSVDTTRNVTRPKRL